MKGECSLTFYKLCEPGLMLFENNFEENEMIKLKEYYSEIEEIVKKNIFKIIIGKSYLSFINLENMISFFLDNIGYSFTTVEISSPVTNDFTCIQIDTLYYSTRLILGISYNTQELIDNYGGKII